MPEEKIAFSSSKIAGEAWGLVKKNFWFFAGLFLISSLPSSISQSLSKSDSVGSGIIELAMSIVSIFISIGIIKIVLNLLDSKELSYNEIMRSGKYFFNYFIASLLYGAIVVIGLLLLIIPGLYWALKYQFVTYLIIDKEIGIGEAFKASGKMTQGIKIDILGFNFLMLGIVLLGLLALVIGLFAALPVTWIAAAMLYRTLVKRIEPATETIQ